MNPSAMLCDMTKCIGCHSCEVACQVNKVLPPDTRLISFRCIEQGRYPDVTRALRRQQCMHCLSPACVSACPVGALQKTATGPVVYDATRCIGCRYCMNACPYNVPTFDWDRGLLDQPLIHKCDFCADRLAEGLQPVCVETCPTQAIIFGERDQLLATAKARIQEHPDRYVQHIYGEREGGGTSLLTLSNIPFERLGLPQLAPQPVTTISEAVMGGTIPFALGWMAVLAGLAGIVRLRERGMKARAEASEQPATHEQEETNR